ncbi:MAG: right-handed parallel beta-helix repeat-containing protein [Verrucomicrobiota bacterium]
MKPVSVGLFIVGIAWLFGSTLTAEEGGSPWDSTLLVNPIDPKATDEGEGHLTQPFKTIGAAGNKALELAEAGKSVRVVIQPGVYAESVTLLGEEDPQNAPIKFEGVAGGEVFLVGTELISGWSIEDHGVFERPWDPDKYEHNPMLFVEVARLVEVDSLRQVGAGKVFFDRSNSDARIYFLPPRGGTVRDGTIQIGRGETAAFDVRNIKNLIFENIAIERSYAFGIKAENCDGLRVHNVSAEYCQVAGLRLVHSSGAELKRLLTDRCGEGGFWVYGSRSLLIERCEANLNGWATPGQASAILLQECGVIKVRNLRVVENRLEGITLLGNQAVELDIPTLIKNTGSGVNIGNVGPTSIKGAEIANNGGAGVLVASTLGLEGNLFYGNAGAQLEVTEGGDVSMVRSILMSTAANSSLIDLSNGSSYGGAENLFYAAAMPEPFILLDKRGGFAWWQEVSTSDLNSFYGDPMLANPSRFDFMPTPKSPFFSRKEWPVRKLD